MKRIYPLATFLLGALSLASSPFNNPVVTPYPRPSVSPTSTPSPSATPAPTPKPSRSPKKTTPTPTPSPRATPTPSPKPAAKKEVKPTATPAATVAAASPTPSVAPADAEFLKVSDEYIKGYLNWRPLRATSLGFHEYDGRLNDFTRLAIDAELERLKRFEERLKKFDQSKLSPQNAIDCRLLSCSVARELFQIRDFGMLDQNPMTYAQAIDVNVYLKRNFAPLEDRVRSIITIENQAPNIVIAAKTNLNANLPRPSVELAIQMARGSADFMKKNLVDALQELKDEKLVAGFQQANRKAWMALTEYANWLEKEKLPAATAPFALGEEKYRRMLRESELVELTPARLLEIGMAELKKEQDAFAAAAKKIDPNKSAPAVFQEVQREHPSPENLIPDTEKKLEAIRQFVLDKHLVSVPSEVRAQVKETPQYRRATSFASMDTPGAYETKATEAYYYVTPPESEWPEPQKEQWLTFFNNYNAEVVSIHEAYPGHYVQFLHLNASNATKPEKIFGSYAFIEGWAHYCEQMVLDAGYGRSEANPPSEEDNKRLAKYEMAQANAALQRLCRLCVSVKMHTQGMTVEDGAKFFRDNSYMEEKPARAEAMRGTFDPGYFNYSLGKLELLKLRKDLETQEGANFNLEQFHNAVLDHGMMPIRLLREILLTDKAKWGEVL